MIVCYYCSHSYHRFGRVAGHGVITVPRFEILSVREQGNIEPIVKWPVKADGRDIKRGVLVLVDDAGRTGINANPVIGFVLHPHVIITIYAGGNPFLFAGHNIFYRNGGTFNREIIFFTFNHPQ